MEAKNDGAEKNTGNGTPNPENSSTNTQNTIMDINRYLDKANYGKSIAGMLRALFKGQMATETEWAEKVKAVIERKA